MSRSRTLMRLTMLFSCVRMERVLANSAVGVAVTSSPPQVILPCLSG